MASLGDRAWNSALTYLRLVGQHESRDAIRILDDVIEREGIGALNDALAEVCRSLLDRIVFEPGTIDVGEAVDALARQIAAVAERDEREVVRQSDLIVFLGSEGLPCAARTEVSSWAPMELLGGLVACMLGLVGAVSAREDITPRDVVATIAPPLQPVAATGTFGLAWRGPEGAQPFAGVIPAGYTAHITFLGEGQCSLREVFARVAYLRDDRQLIGVPTPSVSLQSS